MATKPRTAEPIEPAADPAPRADRTAGLIGRMASKYQVDADKLKSTLKSTVFKGSKNKETGVVREATDEELMTLLLVAEAYNLNPFTKEIYAFPDEKKGGIVPVVSVDGWIRIINERAELQSLEFAYEGFELPSDDPKSDPYIVCTITRSDRSRPLEVREYMRECYRDTGPWQSHPRRMLRHKAMIQCARVAFGFAGIYDHDEAERIRDANAIESTATVVTSKPAVAPPRALEQLAPRILETAIAPAADTVAAGSGELDEAELARMRQADRELAEREAGGQ